MSIDVTARRLLDAIDELKRLEREKRDTPRTSQSYLALAESVERQARRVFEIAQRQRDEADVQAPN